MFFFQSVMLLFENSGLSAKTLIKVFNIQKRLFIKINCTFIFTKKIAMRKIDQLFNEYGESHQNGTNKLIHWICVPLIFWTILGFISLIPAPHFCLAYFGCISVPSIIAVIFVTIFYFRLSWVIAIIMLVVMLLMEHLAYAVNIHVSSPWLVYLIVFVSTWILQFVGHKIEGKKPSFLKDLQFLLVGPAWLLSFILRKLNIKY